jgi:hypothetical protein
MRMLATLAIALALIAPAQSQTPQPLPAPLSSPAIATIPTPKSPEAGAPMKGANSFTEAQVTSRITELGYLGVTGLGKDADGIWRGTAIKDGKTVLVALDYRGNFVVADK